MQFLVIAYDGTDEQAQARRLSAREAHLASIERLKLEGRALYGAAILDEKQAMIGSIVVYDFASREELDRYLEAEPYITGGVWKRIEVMPCRVPPLFLG
ncbi:MAG: YciI family protein [Desulfomonilia bacterium]